MIPSKTQQAVALVKAGAKPIAAAKQVGIAPNAVYLALKREREKILKLSVCPCCGQEIKAP